MVAFREISIRESRRASRWGNRGRIDIIGDILDLCRHGGPIKKTQVMKTANLSTVMTNEYLEFLQERDLIRRNERGYYSITERGARALDGYQRIIELVSIGKKGVVEVR